ncbi:MAG: X-prolyl-dipeptidyl aminopeptidase, partial [Actinomycetota bacterium]|nr:X-prolyl-dipeptidyl aminopeptidase [Actinomycetota bacterium]
MTPQTHRPSRTALAAMTTLFALAATTTALAQVPGPAEDPLKTVQDAVGPEGGSASASDAQGTQPIYGYSDAVRERVFVVADFDSDADGSLDTIAFDIVRPRATETEGLKVPVIMDASPYYTTVCRGNEAECKQDIDGDGRLEKFPLFYDNYFVPRGYAVMLLDMVGTASSNGCPVTGGTPDNRSAVMAIDWLNGRRAGRYADGSSAVAGWHNGKTGMIGKSYDGTLANAAAATGVDGLTTIVPISAISTWYFYTRMNGIVTRGSSYPSSLSNTVTNSDRRAYCAPVRNRMAAEDGDEHGDYSPF